MADTYYWIGENKSNGTFFQSINCYSSTNLVEWSFVRALLTQKDGRGELGARRIVERPKVIYNEQNKNFVMYMHIDDEVYQEAKVGVATSKGVCDQYTYEGSFRPLDHQSRDIGLFKDVDGKAYLMTEDRANGLHIHQLSSTYMKVQDKIHTFPEAIESPALVYLPHIGRYIIFGSHLTGWHANDNVYSSAASLSGPWSPWKPFAKEGSNTFNSQTSLVLPVGDLLIYMGDRWVPDHLERSTYVWQPLEVDFVKDSPDGFQVHMDNLHSWAIDPLGAWKKGETKSLVIQAETGKLFDKADVVNCDRCNTGKAVANLGWSRLRFDIPESTVSGGATVLIHYFLDSKDEQYGTIMIDDGEPERVSFLPTSNITSDGQTKGSFVSSIMGHWGPRANSFDFRGSEECDIVIDHIEILLP